MIKKEVALYIKTDEEFAMRQILEAYREGKVIILSEKPKPLMLSDNTADSDVYCPNCETTLSGIDSEWEGDTIVLQCPHCGAYLDSSKTVSKTEATKEKIEARKKSICIDIGEVYGCYFEEEGQLCIDTGEDSVYRYNTPDELLEDWYPKMKRNNGRKEDEWWCDWSDDLAFIEEHVLNKEGT